MRRPSHSRLSMDMSLASISIDDDLENEKTGYQTRWQNSITNKNSRPTLTKSLSWSSHHSSHKGYDPHYKKQEKVEGKKMDVKPANESGSKGDTAKEFRSRSLNKASSNLRSTSFNKSSSNLLKKDSDSSRKESQRSKSTDPAKTPRRKPTRTKSISDNIIHDETDKPIRRRTKESSRRNTPRRTKSSDEVVAAKGKHEGKLPQRTKTAPSPGLSRAKSSRSFRADRSMRRLHQSQRLLEDTATPSVTPALNRSSSSDSISASKQRGSTSRRVKSSRKLLAEDRNDAECKDTLKSKSPTRGVRRAASNKMSKSEDGYKNRSKIKGALRDLGRSERVSFERRHPEAGPRDLHPRDLGRSSSIIWERRHSERQRRTQRSKSTRMITAESNSEEKIRRRKDRRASCQNQKSFRNLNVALAQVQQLERHQRKEAEIWKAVVEAKQREVDVEKLLTDTSIRIESTGTSRKEKDEVNEDSKRSNSSSKSLGLLMEDTSNCKLDDLDDSIRVIQMELHMSKPFLSEAVFDV